MFARLALLALLAAPLDALAGGIAVVDFQRAVTETDEGKAAQDKLDTMYATRKAEIDRLGQDLEHDLQDYQQKAMILSEEARADTERTLQQKQDAYQQKYGQYQQEMQETYYTLLQDLDVKMRTMTEQIAKEKGYDVVLDSGAVVYHGGNTVDMTDELIRRYNAAN